MKTCCQTITYRLRNTVSPKQVMETLGALLEKHNIAYSRCLWKMLCPIIEYEFEGKFHSNREKNGVLRICKAYPQLASFYRYVKKEERDERHVLTNHTDYIMTAENDHRDTVAEVMSKIPRPYSIRDVEYIWDGVDFLKKGQTPSGIHQSYSGAPLGSYIWYSRSAYGNERYSYLTLSVDEVSQEEDMIPIRKFFFELMEKLPGKYKGTEVRE